MMDELYRELIEECRLSGMNPKSAAKAMDIQWDTVRRWQKRNISNKHANTVRAFIQHLQEMRREYKTNPITDTDINTREEKMATAMNSSKTNGISDDTRLSKEEIDELLTVHEIIRDPVHQDIWITALERAIIDTPAFQRLRNLNQLGPTQLVYPGATHNRFLHSLGTLHCAQELVQTINRNYKVYAQPSLMEVEPYPHLLVRLVALLHDVAHMPFGHTFSKEGNLIEDEWDDDARVKMWLEDDGAYSISEGINSFLIKKGIAEVKVKALLHDVRQYLINMKNPMAHEYPYVCDLVGNTLCADLLDYLERDMYFCGLKERSGDRVIRYVSVMRLSPIAGKDNEFKVEKSEKPDTGKGRVVLLAYRFEKEHGPSGKTKPVIKNEILSEAIDLLRRRFALAEKVYFHRTKIAASAMLISAANSATTQLSEFYKLGEEKVLEKLQDDPNERCKYIIEAYKERRLFKPVYRIDFITQEENADSEKLWGQIYPEYRDKKERLLHEKEIEYLSGLTNGSVVIYCPHKDMNTKEFEMLVHYNPEGIVKKLGATLEGERQEEMRAINKRFQKLWKLQVLIDPKVLDVTQVSNNDVKNLATLCEGLIDFPNSDLSLRQKGLQLDWQVVRRVINDYQNETGKDVPTRVEDELITSMARGSVADRIEDLKIKLQAIMETAV